jgi:hypothetical protein
VKSGANFLQLVGKASLSADVSSDLFLIEILSKEFRPFKKSLFQIDGRTLRLSREVLLYSDLIIEKYVCLARFNYLNSKSSQRIRLTSAEL